MKKEKMCKINKKTKKRIKESGCIDPINGVKSKCLITIVPKNVRRKTFKMDPRCRAKLNS